MFSDEGKKEVDNFLSYLNNFEEDRKKRVEIIKRIDKLLGKNSQEDRK